MIDDQELSDKLASERLSFSGALMRLKSGKRVCRSGWNGKGMWLRLVRTEHYGVRDELTFGASTPRPELLPWIGMKTADNKFVPWLASQTDILAEDWEIVA